MSVEIPGKKIFLHHLTTMFANIESGPKWDMTAPMLWGYFFTHSEPARLEAAAEKLTEYGLQCVGVQLAEKKADDAPDVFRLHMAEVRAHSPESLDERNNELYLFAHNEGIDTYVGMDVKPVNKAVLEQA